MSSMAGVSRRRAHAFTLVEFAVVMAITAIALGIVMIRLGRSAVLLSKGERIARGLVADLRLAQSEAITHARNHYLLFTEDGGQYTEYTIYRVEDGGDVQIEPARLVPDGVALTGAATRAEFAPGGDAIGNYTYTVTSAGSTMQIDVILSTGAVELTEL